MTTYRMTAPDGKTYQVDGPEGASDDQVRAEIIRQNPHLSEAPQEKPEPSYLDKYVSGLKNAGNSIASTFSAHPVKATLSIPSGILEPIASGVGQTVADASALTHSLIDKIPGSHYIGNFDPNKTFAQRKAEYEEGIGKYTNPQTEVGKSIGQSLGAALKPVSDVIRLPAKAVGAASTIFGASPETAASIEDQGSALTNAVLLGQANRASNPKEITTDAPIPSKSALKQSAQQAYKNAEDAGATISGESYASAVGDLRKSLQDEGLNSKLMPNTSAALEHISEHEGPITVKQLDTYRKVARAAESNSFMNPADARMAGKIIDHIDDFMENIGEKDIAGGAANNAADAVSSLKEARGLWSRYKKADTIDNLIEKADLRASQFSGSGYENALRTEFRKFAMNDKKMRGFNPEEQAAIKSVASGGPIGNALRYFGKLAPSGIVSGFMSAKLGEDLAGAAGSGAVMGGGALSRYLATKSTEGRAIAAQELMRRGPNPPPPQVSLQPGNLNLAPLLIMSPEDQQQNALVRALQEAK